ncbi:MAG: flavohemoglobin expression-modulating QEGLA motif protein [Polyangiaceae bacterium]
MHDPSSRRPWRSYKEILAHLAARVVDAQRPIRVLHALQWPANARGDFLAAGGRELPRVDLDHYASTDLAFEPRDKSREFLDLRREIERELGSSDPLGNILAQTAEEYALVAEMLAARGTARFYELSRSLYGSPKDVVAGTDRAVRAFALEMYRLLTNLDDSVLGPLPVRNITAEEAVSRLNTRLSEFFGDGVVRVILDDGIVADASAGSDYVKLRQGAMFSEQDILVLEVHEGWVHVATSLNGQKQPVSRWLAKGPPRTAATQEGLAALLEVLTLNSHPNRARRLNDRVLAVDKAEDGASFVDVFEWFRTEGYDEDTCFWNTQRIFRGGLLEGGAPFTKDIVYTRGIVENYEFLRRAIVTGRAELARWLFVGKVHLDDVAVLAGRAHEGVVAPPRFVPHLFNDLKGLAIWLGVSTFWGRMSGPYMPSPTLDGDVGPSPTPAETPGTEKTLERRRAPGD